MSLEILYKTQPPSALKVTVVHKIDSDILFPHFLSRNKSTLSCFL